jgi:hypothetical protein
VLVAYPNGLGAPFVFDDESVTGNASIRGLWPAWGALSPPPAGSLAGRPAANLTFALNYAIGGPGVWSYHAVNVLVHMTRPGWPAPGSGSPSESRRVACAFRPTEPRQAQGRDPVRGGPLGPGGDPIRKGHGNCGIAAGELVGIHR